MCIGHANTYTLHNSWARYLLSKITRGYYVFTNSFPEHYIEWKVAMVERCVYLLKWRHVMVHVFCAL